MICGSGSLDSTARGAIAIGWPTPVTPGTWSKATRIWPCRSWTGSRPTTPTGSASTSTPPRDCSSGYPTATAWRLRWPDSEQGARDGFQWNTVIFGGEGYRPTLNSYMVADAVAIARLAELAGDRATAETFRRKAEALRKQDSQRTVEPRKAVFHAAAGRRLSIRRRREEIGFFPWAFHLPDNSDALAAAWQQLGNAQGFNAKYAPPPWSAAIRIVCGRSSTVACGTGRRGPTQQASPWRRWPTC